MSRRHDAAVIQAVVKVGRVTEFVNGFFQQVNFRNLLGGSLARLWTEAAALPLRNRLPAMARAPAQDGGVAVDDIPAHLPDEDGAELTREVFLS